MLERAFLPGGRNWGGADDSISASRSRFSRKLKKLRACVARFSVSRCCCSTASNSAFARSTWSSVILPLSNSDSLTRRFSRSNTWLAATISHGAAGLEPIEIGDRDVTPQSARDGHAVEAARIEQRALRANGGGNRGCVQRLAHDYARVLLFLAQELHGGVGNLGERCGLALRGEQLVQSGVDGIERRAQRDREFASAFGARVAGLQRNLGEEARACCGQRLGCPLDFETLALQGEVTAQALGYVALDHRVEFAFAARLGDRGE